MDTSLTLDFICKAFASQVDWQVEPVFSHSFHTDDMPIQKGVIQAAVFFPLVQRPSGLHVLFTRRASHLYDHAGQISFPGGRIEPRDVNAAAAALRATQEEIRSEEHTSELQSLMHHSYAVFCLKQKNTHES